jgi:hypothetical protein
MAAFHAAWKPVGTSAGITLTGGPIDKVAIVSTGDYRSQRSFAEFAPTAQEDLQISFKIAAWNSGTSSQYLELLDGAGGESGQLLQLGMYGSEWSVRMRGSAEADTFAPMDPAAQDALVYQWATFKAVIHRESETTASARVHVNDVLGKTLSGFQLPSYDTVRIGSGVSNGLFVFDDVLVQSVAVPEPAAVGAAASAVGAMALRRRRRRRWNA